MREGEGTPAGADGVEQVEHALAGDLGGHGDFGGVERGETGADAAGPGDDAADAGSDVVGALVAEDLQRHAGSGLAFEGRIGGVLGPGLGERGEKAARGGTKAGAGDVDFHGLAVEVGHRRGGHSCIRVSQVSEARSGAPDVVGRVLWLMRGSPGLRES